MAAKIWLGFGGCKFESDQITATFPGGDGKIDYTPLQIIKENDDFNLISRLYGYRVNIETNQLYNLADTDYQQYQYLAQILNYLVSSTSQRYVTITPRNDSTVDTPLPYDCILTSKVSSADLCKIKLGQVMSLKFLVLDKVTQIPTLASDQTEHNFVFETSNETEQNAVFETSDETEENAVVYIN